ncbi:putative reverse transcriptase domain-containing protein [Tanacetum coccineum]
MALTRRSNYSNGANPVIAAIITQQNGENGNGRNENGGNNGCSYKAFLACKPRDFDRKGGTIALTRWIKKMESVIDNSGCADNQKVKYAVSSFINKALTWWNTHIQARGNEATIGMTWEEFKELLVEEYYPKSKRIRRTLSKGSEKRKLVEETSKQGGSGNEKGENDGPFRLCNNCQKPSYFARDCRVPVKQAVPVNAVRVKYDQGTCYECGSPDYFCNTCPKLNRAPSQVKNRLTIEGNRNTRNTRNQARGRAFNMKAVSALQDPKVVTGTFSLNDHFATTLFDSRAAFSFISTKFMSFLNVKPSIVKPGYVIEVVDGKKVEVDRIIRGCKLELGNSMFTIDLIPLGYGSFDVIVRMDWMFEHKAVIVCHEKVVRIPLASGKILQVQRERALESPNSLMNTKLDEQKLDDNPVV